MSQRTPVRATQQSAETPRLRPTDSAQTPKIELPVPAAASGPRGLPSDSTRTPAQSARTPVNSARTPARSARTPIIALPPERAASAQATDDELTALSSPGGSRSVATNSPEGTRRLQDLLARRQGSGPASGKD